MDHSTHNQIVSFIWGIADDVLRDVYVRGKYRDVILPMTVLRRLDVLLEPTKDAVLEMRDFCEKEGIEEMDAPLQQAAGYPFYNTSKFTLRRLLDSPTNLRANLEAYLLGFSKNVQEIVSKFKLHNQLDTLEEADVLFLLVEKFLSLEINLSPHPGRRPDGTGLPGLSNLGMGYVFEELIRKFNEENNEEAGEHFTPREIIRLMSRLIFEPVADEIESSTYLVYDPACGSGGMLTESEAMLLDPTTWAADAALHDHARSLQEHFGAERQRDDFADFEAGLKAALKALGIKLGAPERKALVEAVTFVNPEAAPVVAREVADYSGSEEERRGKRHHGLFRGEDGKRAVTYQADGALKDTEQVPLTEPGGIHAYFEREVLPHVPDAWIDASKTQIGYEIPFTRHFYEYQPLRPLEEIAEDLRALEAEAEQLLEEVLS